MTYLDLIRDADRKLDTGKNTLGEYEEMIEPLKREIQPERKRGEWKRSTDNGYSMYECSVCGCRMWKTEYDKAVGTHGFKFCPYCGADMRGGDLNE